MTNVLFFASNPGEITVLDLKSSAKGPLARKNATKDSEESELELIQAVAKSLHVQTSEELKEVQDVLYPAMLCSAAFKVRKETNKKRFIHSN